MFYFDTLLTLQAANGQIIWLDGVIKA